MFVITTNMGIKNLSKFLKTNYPEQFELIHISEYAYKKVSIDVSLYLCNFKAVYGEEGWLKQFINMVACLRKNEVHCVFIYDTGSPPEKEPERKKRMEARKKIEDRVMDLELAIEKFHMTSEVDKILTEFQEKRKIPKPRMLRDDQNMINITAIEFAVQKMRKQLFRIKPEDYTMTKKVFDLLDVPYFDAPMEAETMCADLCKKGLVDAVLSEDTDVLAYGSPVFLTKFIISEECCMRLKTNDLWKDMNMTREQFLDFCILCGTDYNDNIFRVGPSKAYKYISEYKTIENVGRNTKHDISVLKHVRSRELFLDYESKDVKVSYCGKPNFNKLQEFLFKNNLNMDVNELKKSFTRSEIQFVSDEIVDSDVE